MDPSSAREAGARARPARDAGDPRDPTASGAASGTTGQAPVRDCDDPADGARGGGADPAATAPSAHPANRGRLAGPGLAALGIVYGDLGTSPLYTVQSVLSATHGKVGVTGLLGSFSLLFWALVFVVTFKYAALVMRADNRGEGGILALLSLAVPRFPGGWTSRASLLTAAGLFGAALLYGDGVITPSISMLSALEGVSVVTGALKPYVLPGAIAILVALFAAQSFGTSRIGFAFGPVMLLWFVAIGGIGAWNAARHPAVFRGLDPMLGLEFLAAHRFGSLVMLGAVFLAVTGSEALYADMSHVGRGPVRVAWLLVVLPALLLSYAGQIALLLGRPEGQGNPFWLCIPHPLRVPMVVLATLATIIASQAIITGSFTLTRQAMQLGWFPGLNIRQTSDREYGQIYVPVVNWTMMIGTVLIALAFRSSDALSGAYGTAVSTTMLMTTLLIYDVMRDRWRWPAALASAVAGTLLVVDCVFFVANLLKILEGGFVPLGVGAALFVIMVTWHRGIELIKAGLKPLERSADAVLAQLRAGEIARTPGTFVFLSRWQTPVPPIVARFVAQFHALPARIVVLGVTFQAQARIDVADRLEIERVMADYWLVRVRFGYNEVPNLALALQQAAQRGCGIEVEEAMFIAADDDIVADHGGRQISAWRRMLFGVLYRNAVRASDRFTLPRDRLIEIGHQIGI